MSETRDFLRSIDLPPGDANDLPDSAKRFPDGAQYRIEIPSTEGPRCLEAVLEEAAHLEVNVHRVSQGSAKPGDIVVFDWGDGGITDHVAIYIGHGQRIGGNESDQVSKSPVDWGASVGIRRPPYGA